MYMAEPGALLTEEVRGGRGATEILSRRRLARGGAWGLARGVSVVDMDAERDRGRRFCFVVVFSLSWIFCRCRKRRSLKDVSGSDRQGCFDIPSCKFPRTFDALEWFFSGVAAFVARQMF
jgi:hypothetical protein